MFCNNCGTALREGERFCNNCGAEIVNTEKKAPVAPSSEVPLVSSVSTANPSVSPKKKILITSVLLCAAVIAIVTTVIVFFAGNSADESDYTEGIKNYLDYIADENDSVSDFLAYTYFSGSFGEYYSGDDAADIHKIIAETMFSDNSSAKSRGYSYYYGYDAEDSWKDYFENTIIKDFYRDMNSVYGDWSFDYKILDAKKLSSSNVKDLQTDFEDIIDNYDSWRKDVSDTGDREECEEFIESIEELQVEKAYEVNVDIEIDGDDESYDDEVDFVVAKIGDEWVIMEGPDFSEFTNP